MTAYSKSFVGGRPTRLGTETFTDNGTYVAIDFQNSQGKALDGFSSVVVNLPLGAKTITANGTYSASDDSLKGYSSLSVNVPPNVGEVSFSQNGEYLASDYKLQGFSKVTVATPYEELFSATGNITTLDLYITAARSKCFYGYDSLQSLVLRNGAALLPTIQAALPTDLAQGANLTIYVPETSVADYSALYSAYYTIKPLTEYGRYWYDIVTAATVLTSNLYVSAIQAFADTKDPYDGLRIPSNITSIYSGALTPITDPASTLKVHDLDFMGTIAAFATTKLVDIDSNFANASCPIDTFRYQGVSNTKDQFASGAMSIKYFYFDGVAFINQFATYASGGVVSSNAIELHYPKATEIGTMAFKGMPNLEKVFCPKVTQFDDLSHLGGYVQNCPKLIYADFSGCTDIKNYFFSGCSLLNSGLVIDFSKVTAIGIEAFRNCLSFSRGLNLDSCTLVKGFAFSNSKIPWITLKSVITIEGNAFVNMPSLKFIDLSDNPSVPTIGSSAFQNTTNAKIRVPYSKISDYWIATNWSALTSYFVGVLKADAAVTLDAIKIIDGIQYTVTWHDNPDLTGTAVSGDQPAGTYYAKLSI